MQLNSFTPVHKAALLVAAMRLVEERALGDAPGHEFHGNQWTGGEGGTTSEVRASQTLTQPGLSESMRKQFDAQEELRLAQNIQGVRGAAKRNDISPDNVRIESYDKTFKVGEKVFREGGHFEHETGDIVLNAESLSRSSFQGVEEMFVHEAMHRDWKDTNELLGLSSGSTEEHVPAGSVGAQIQSIYRDQKDELTRTDGITDYSRAYWDRYKALDKSLLLATKSKAYEAAVNETLAEISAGDLNRAWGRSTTGKQYNDPYPVWRELHTKVKAFAKEARTP